MAFLRRVPFLSGRNPIDLLIRIFFRLGPTVAWDVYRGFGFRFSAAARLGFVDYPTRDDQFGAGIDVVVGIFWAM